MVVGMSSCNSHVSGNNSPTSPKEEKIVTAEERYKDVLITTNDNEPVPAAYLLNEWIGKLKGKKVALVGNQTSVVRTGDTIVSKEWKSKDKLRYTHLVDTLLAHGIDIKRVFAPEHGFRGTADAGATIKDGIDAKTGIPIISLYGKNKKPFKEQLEDVDIVLFDIQDVGARFYTYISTLHYVMEACAQYNKKIIVLDRPNPNGHYIDGPILEEEHQSFVGMHPVPVVHGMTIGEYAQMINGEKWLEKELRANLEIIKCKNYTHDSSYSIPIKPSPNLPNDQSINLYPSLCFFEGADVSVGRGTEMQFQVYGSPSLVKYTNFEFTPTPNVGAKRPLFNGKKCYGVDLREYEKLDHIELEFLVDAFAKAPYKSKFFNSFFTKLAGTETLQAQIEKGMSAQEIAATWEKGLEEYQKMRVKYLLYE
ncbi:uncharacterized protein YbbC (DUF1343 family) [Nonlabens dokdonensis]|uniref:Secreted protein containing DUF1343 n=3 Tax=Nonlabens dokdonensis TaxID=328515 RepID=L7WE24_NONDD|nr:secreted protein containing DUF1343 [Nonlabens dokdonensis DSW-6]PZX41111.1 uncharacterized protein YbbC (DUF1343 family) [Nonlabens dokdonensis]